MAWLQLAHVNKSYPTRGGSVSVLRDINLELEKGEFVAVVGYSGAGKTTLISLVAGLTRPDTGTVTLNDLEIREPGPDRGVVFQNYSLLPWLTVFENIYLAVEQVFPNWSEAKKRQHTESYVAMVHLTPARDKRPRELSGGMRQRVALARGLAMEPQLLLLDEPLSALDALTRGRLQEEIARMGLLAQRTILLITNDVDEGILLADRIVPLSAGPGATLGPSVPVNLARPRQRATMNFDPQFHQTRRTVLEFLRGPGAPVRNRTERKLVLPDIEPEDLTGPPPLIGGRRTPVRRSEIRRETVATGSP